MLVGVEESLVPFTFQHLEADCPEGFLQQAGLLVLYPLIVNLRQGVKLFLQGLIFLVDLHSGFRQGDELRMEGEGGIGIIRIGVRPGTCHRRVIDGKHLDYALPCHGSPVGKFLQVLELAHSETVLALEREHRNRNTGTPPWLPVKFGIPVANHEKRTLSRNFSKEVVGAGFPQDGIPL